MSEIPYDAQNSGYVQAQYEQYARDAEAEPEAWRRVVPGGPAETVGAGLLIPEGLSTSGAYSGNGAQAATMAPPTRMAAAPSVGVAPGGPALEDGKLDRLMPAVARATSLVQAFRD